MFVFFSVNFRVLLRLTEKRRTTNEAKIINNCDDKVKRSKILDKLESEEMEKVQANEYWLGAMFEKELSQAIFRRTEAL